MFTVFDESEIDILAKKSDYKKIKVSLREDGRLSSYVKDGYRVDVFLTTGTVATCLDKPKSQDPTVIFRRNMNKDDIKKILDDPKPPVRKCYNRMPNGEKDERLYDVSTCKFKFRYDSMERAFIDDLDTIYESALNITLGYDGYFVLNHDGTFVSHNLPRKLRYKLEDRVASDPIPTVVSLGTEHPDTYFLQFADGKRSWRRLPQELEDILEDTEHYVDIMALGEEEDYYVKFSNGKEFWNIPSKLADRLRGKHGEKTVAAVSLGYEDQYNVRFSDGSMTSNMKSKTFWREYDDITVASGVKLVAMGAKGDYIILG